MVLETVKYKPLFMNYITKRLMEDNLNLTVLFEGKFTGVGKSYMAMYLAEQFHMVHKDVLKPFTVDNIFFKPEDAMDFIGKAPRYSVGIYDDAGATASHRSWFDEVINILSTTVQTYRFRNLGLFLTVPFGIQVDVDLRRLSNLSVVVHDRGYASVYSVTFQKFANKGRGAIYYNHIFNLGIKDDKKFRVSMPSKDLYTKYEEKKSATFQEKWEIDKATIISAKRQAEWIRLKTRSDTEIMDEIINNSDKYRNGVGKIDLNLIQFHGHVGFARGRRIMSLLDEVHNFR